MKLVFWLAAGLAFAQTPEYTYKIVHVYPHDTGAFTEGLEYRGGFLYESTGLEGQSFVRKTKLETGAVVQQIRLDPKYFGEGITVMNQKIFQLTYKTQIGFVYAQDSMQRQRTFNYSGEGWALTNDGQQIYMSDGSAEIRVWDPATLQEKRRIKVHEGTAPVERVNELEWVNGEIYANVWMTDDVLRISPKDGRVLGKIHLAGLLDAKTREQVDVLNGIAYDAMGGRLFVTGKFWPKLFEIQIVRKNSK